MTHTLLLIGGDLCERVATRLGTNEWRCAGLRQRPHPMVELYDALTRYEACL